MGWNVRTTGRTGTLSQKQASRARISLEEDRPPPGERSDYTKYLPGQVTRIRLKIEQNCRLVVVVFCVCVCVCVDISSSATMNDLTMTFTSRLKMDAKCADQQ